MVINSLRVIPAAILLACIGLSGVPVQASQFFVFPVKELEGVSDRVPSERRPLVDIRARQLLTPPLQAELNAYFAERVASVYPGSVVHAKQVGNALKGSYQYVNSDSQTCGDGFQAPVQKSYAAVVGITRASWYEVSRERGTVELLVPITLNIQLIKPDKGKVVYSLSDTLYSTFRFGSPDELMRSRQSVVADTIRTGLRRQIDELVSGLSKGFAPKEAVVTIVGSSEGVLVADKGFEVGFVAPDEPSALNQRTKREVVMKVLSVESGYSVLSVVDGDVREGDKLVFQFEAAADDSRKPRVLPVTSLKDPLVTSAADLFAKDIGFAAKFQIAAVDPNFKDTLQSIEAQAPCVSWSKFEALRKDFESRQDAPDFLLKFEPSLSPVLFESGRGGVETRESFMAAVGVHLVDLAGNVVHSEFGSDLYRLDKKGSGLNINNAHEIALKNAARAAAKKFISNAKFQPAEYEVASASKTSFSVRGLSLPVDGDLVYEVYRPLRVDVGGKRTVWRLPLDEGSAPPRADGGEVVFAYSSSGVQVKRGDRLRVTSVPGRGQQRLAECKAHYVAPNSLAGDFLLPMVRHAAYSNNRFQVALTDPAFYQDANALLDEGKFRRKVAVPGLTETCVRVGYAIRPDSPKCADGLCGFDMLAATTVILEKGGERVGNFVEAEKVNVSGVAQSQIGNFSGLKAAEVASKNLARLIEKLNKGK